MVDEAKVTESIKEFMDNPEWKDVFQQAPAGAMERMAISFYFSKQHNDFSDAEFDEYRNLREEVERSLDEEDLNYLIEHINKEDSKAHYQQLLDKLKEKKGEQTQEEAGAPEKDGTVTVTEQVTTQDEEPQKEETRQEPNWMRPFILPPPPSISKKKESPTDDKAENPQEAK